ncbi:hypothetical protein [Crateriforma conspicua]|uniref:Uncharacterized protein n=2 Tax=Crateriforma conspicua TaxID=2527996 RepID=A0A5C5YB80_9PLAN|nr:hypothetical protein [Crateriforma conspicua]QDV66250.1 hypothetical protein Mal65_54260 [Crateriforma conspicua]TWT72640.1 hypothetical protein Pan14r_49600 [Crateriforma conspicua]
MHTRWYKLESDMNRLLLSHSCVTCAIRSAPVLLLFSLAGCSQTSESTYTVKQTAVNLGNIMYNDGEDGMYDVWYDGIELTNGRSTILIAMDGSEPNYDKLSSMSVGDRVQIKTDLSLLRPNLLDAYWASDVDIATLD